MKREIEILTGDCVLNIHLMICGEDKPNWLQYKLEETVESFVGPREGKNVLGADTLNLDEFQEITSPDSMKYVKKSSKFSITPDKVGVDEYNYKCIIPLHSII